MFVFDLETCNDQEFAEAYAAGLYDVNRLRDNCDGDLPFDELEIERQIITVVGGSNGNSVVNMPNYISENYEGDERTFIDRDGDEIVISYILFLVAHKSSGFVSWVVVNPLVEE